VTVAARQVPVREAGQFGVLEVDAGGRIVDFAEKPPRPRPTPADPDRAFVSMGNYLFSSATLVETLVADARRASAHDFGRTIIPELFPRARVFAYDFQQNDVPGVKPYEERGYWRDVGTLEAYWRAHMDLLGEAPVFDLDNPRWPILTDPYQGPPARFVGGDIQNAHIGAGSLVKHATIRNSILGRNVWVNDGAVIEDSVVMDYTAIGKGAHLRRAIVDRFNIIGAGREIGLSPEEDRQAYHVDPSGLVVIPRGGRRELRWPGDEED
jgi:glucose-1-phosphate adenylyltransferase